MPADHDQDQDQDQQATWEAARQAATEQIAAALGDIADLLDRAHHGIAALIRSGPMVDDGLEQARTQLAHLGSGIALTSLRLRQLRRRYAATADTSNGNASAGPPPA